jgi:hypothetical protein
LISFSSAHPEFGDAPMALAAVSHTVCSPSPAYPEACGREIGLCLRQCPDSHGEVKPAVYASCGILQNK